MTEDPSPPPPRRAGRGVVAAAVAVTAVVTAGAVAWAGSGAGDDPDDAGTGERAAAPVAAAASTTDPGPGAGGARPGPHGHGHADRTPYEDRYAAAPAGEQQAAADLVAEVRATLAAFPTSADAEAAGYRPPRPDRAPGGVQHYLNRDSALDGTVLDPSRPDGLVYYTGGGDPALLGAFFIAPRGAEAPSPAPDLVTWHTHDSDCAQFFVTATEPCTASRRMLHVWTADQVTWTSPRTGRSGAVEVTDPFGAPFTASIARAG
jgi:hypothetical protein